MISAMTTPRWLAPAQPLFARLQGRRAPGRPVVTGHVLSSQVVQKEAANGALLYAAEVRFLYNVHARTREGRWLSPAAEQRSDAETFSRRFYPGAKPRVVYEPDDPTRAELQLG